MIPAWLRVQQVQHPFVERDPGAQREHQEFMHTVQAVAEENGSVLAALPMDGVAVFPADDAQAPVRDVPHPVVRVDERAAAVASDMTPSTVINDAPFVRVNSAGKAWAPKNFDGKFHGPMPIRQALTGMDHGPEMAALFPLIGEERARKRLSGQAA